MCQVRSGAFRLLAISSARTDLPVPGSPFTSSGRSRVIAALTATVRSSVATYDSVPAKRAILPPFLDLDPTLAHRAEKWTRFSPPSDALGKKTHRYLSAA